MTPEAFSRCFLVFVCVVSAVIHTTKRALSDRHIVPPSKARPEVEIAPGVHMPMVANGITSDYSLWLAKGGRHIDTAFLYGDARQRSVGHALVASALPRAAVFITTKVNCCPTDRCPGFCSTPPKEVGIPPLASVEEQFEHSLDLLGMDYVDLLLLHFPCSAFEDTARAYASLERIHWRGQAKAIGVSNLNASTLAALLARSTVKPAVNQAALSIAGHPAVHDGDAASCQEGSRLYGSDLETVRFCQSHGITYMAYSPLGSISRVNVLHQPAVHAAVRAHDVSAAQVGIRWLVQQGIAVVTATSDSQHVAEALDVFNFALSEREMAALTRVRCLEPATPHVQACRGCSLLQAGQASCARVQYQ